MILLSLFCFSIHNSYDRALLLLLLVTILYKKINEIYCSKETVFACAAVDVTFEPVHTKLCHLFFSRLHEHM